MKAAGKKIPDIKPSKVLFGLTSGKIIIFPKSFPILKADTSAMTEIKRAVKNKFLEKISVIG